MHGLKTAAGLVKILAHMIGKDQIAFEIIGPGMITADKITDRGMRPIDQARAAMATNIVIGADLLVVIAHDQDRGLANIDNKHIAGLGNIRLNADIDPVLAKDQGHVGLKYVGPGIEVSFKAVTGRATGDQFG